MTSHVPLKFLILEDDSRRARAMTDRLGDRFPFYETQIVATCAEFVARLQTHNDILLISLDHDLEPATPDAEDPGTGVVAAGQLSAMRPFCPIVIHTTNTQGGDEMERVLGAAGWTVSRVVPYEDLLWIDEVWLPKVRSSVLDLALNESVSVVKVQQRPRPSFQLQTAAQEVASTNIFRAWVEPSESEGLAVGVSLPMGYWIEVWGDATTETQLGVRIPVVDRRPDFDHLIGATLRVEVGPPVTESVVFTLALISDLKARFFDRDGSGPSRSKLTKSLYGSSVLSISPESAVTSPISVLIAEL